MKVPPSVRTIAPRGFSLIELLTVMAIIVILMVVAGPSISAISGSGTVNKAAADVQRTLELARLYAMSHQTYVRVGFSDIPDTTPGVPEGAIVILPVASADGTLSATNMAASNWPALARPMVLKTFELRGDIVTVDSPDSTSDAKPNDPNNIPVMNDRNVTGIGTPPFTHFIQFRPDGQAGVNADTPSRYIRVGLDKRGGQKDRNRVILRLSGNNGTVTMLREEDGISTQ